MNINRAIIEQDMKSNPIFRNFNVDEIVEIVENFRTEKGYQRFTLHREEAFTRDPCGIYERTGKKATLYRWKSGVVKNASWYFDEVWMEYTRESWEYYIVPYEYRHTNYAEIANILIDRHYTKASGVFKIYANSNQIFATVKDHSIYFDPLIFSKKELRTPEYTVEFYRPYCTMYDCNKSALRFIESPEGKEALNEFFTKYF